MFQAELDEASTFFFPPKLVKDLMPLRPFLCSVIKQLVIKTSARKSRKFACAEKGQIVLEVSAGFFPLCKYNLL